MGLDINGTKFLLYARRHGVSFSKTALIGRQEMQLNAANLAANLGRFGFQLTEVETGKLLTVSNNYAEGFLKFLGAEEIVSFDASTYENASVVHDFNQPIPDRFKNQFSAVLDGGTLEHVFNYPAAIKNCMEMVTEGGHFLAITPTNNHSGHGFYQFSPELFFRVFCELNGFELLHLVIFEETPDSPWYDVANPDAVKERVTLINDQPSMLLVIAKKIKTVEIFGSMPQQSDYVAIWTGRDEIIKNHPPGFARLPFRRIFRLPLIAFRQIRMRANRALGILNRRTKHFKKVDLP